MSELVGVGKDPLWGTKGLEDSPSSSITCYRKKALLPPAAEGTVWSFSHSDEWRIFSSALRESQTRWWRWFGSWNHGGGISLTPTTRLCLNLSSSRTFPILTPHQPRSQCLSLASWKQPHLPSLRSPDWLLIASLSWDQKAEAAQPSALCF